MRAPPPVEVASALGRAWATALSLLVGASVAVPLAWGLPYVASHGGSVHPDPVFTALGDPAVQGGIACWIGLMAGVAFWLSRQVAHADERRLRWDGQDWVIPGDAAGRPDQRGRASLMLDLGPWMLVRFSPDAAAVSGAVGSGRLGGTRWLPFFMASDVARWAALRGALWTWRGDCDPTGRRP